MSLIECPYCQNEITLSNQEEWTTCSSCQNKINYPAQQAFTRAEISFTSALELFEQNLGTTRRNIYRSKAKPDSIPLDADLIRISQRIYSSLRVALEYDLPPKQKNSAIEMMADVTQLFAPRAITSPMEAEYWTKLMIALTARNEQSDIEEKLSAQTSKKIGDVLRRRRWQRRKNQLTGALTKLETRIQELERAIGFINPPKVH
jgi:hypothetical protein